jgi:Type II secretion system protein C
LKFELLRIPFLSGAAMFDAATRLIGVAIALGAIILAGWWLTELTAPRPVARLPSATFVQPETSIKTMARLFGVSEARPQAVEGLRLTGVFAGSKGGGFATFHTRSGAVSVFPGDEIVPGVRLKQMERDRVIVLTADTQRELRLGEDGVAVASPREAEEQ